MDNTLYVALSQQTALERQMDVVANNLANMNTTAFKRESVLFQQYLKDTGAPTASDKGDIAFVFDYGVARNYTPGAYITTGNTFDVAVTDRGFLEVQGPNGKTMYTRNGHMQRAADGTLVTSSGAPVLDADGNTINIAENELQVKIAKDGTISGSSGRLAKLAIVEFSPKDEQSIKKAGNSLFTTTATPQPSTKSKLLQGMVEGSNVEPIKEMTTMMQISRAYEQTARMLQQYQDLQNHTITTIGKVS